ncbi:vascular cell adhesion protein 1-like [Enoplosus armatus]|uniref:vascular cell adhesion protein 1-like n=1 Tax=Enoplosus armatus TaxID=215367 RepID=UPI003992BD6B
MFFRLILLVVSLMSFLRGLHVFGCDENCADKPVFTPSRVVVKYGDPTSASCSVCQHACLNNLFGLEIPVGVKTTNRTTISWTIDRMTEWDVSATCYYNNAAHYQCCSILPMTLYQPPDNVSISFINHTGPMFEGHQYTLQCTVQDVAPVENLIVTFYRGQTALGQRQLKKNIEKTPVTEIFTLNISPSHKDDGVQYWCEAKLELGPEGPQHPPVMMSQTITATVYYKPQLKGPSYLNQITITEGNRLQLNCSAVGNPSPSFTWTLPFASPPTTGGSSVIITSVTSAHEGQYTCSVSNDVGTITVKFNVVVEVTLYKTFDVCVTDENCADKPVFTPSRVVVKYGDPTSASCSVCQHACLNNLFGLEIPVGVKATNRTTISWTIDRMTEWDVSATCYYNNATNYQCCSILPMTLYQPPDNVSISFINHTGPMFEGHQYTLQCTVQGVAPVENLIVTFYRGQTALGQRQLKKNTEKTPVTEIFTLNISPSHEDDGVQYWCEAKLELGPEGPQHPPVMMSQTITATVYYEPQLEGSSRPDPVIITEGNPLQLNCSAVGNPSPSYSWMLPSDSTPPPSGSVLTINSVAVEHKGQYTCFVSNSVGTVTVNYIVDVQANNIVSIIVGTVVGAFLVITCIVLVYICFYKPKRMGKYNLKDVFRLHKQHAAVPTAE